MKTIDKIEFWEWAYSDFLSNTQRGVLAEFIVGKALGCLNGKRREWDAYDLVTNEGVKIEVKAAGYLQSWSQKKISKIRFDLSEKKSWYAETNSYQNTKSRVADIYIFCIHQHKDLETVNSLDISQWEFYVIPTMVLVKKIGKQKTIGLNKLLEIGAKRTEFSQLSNILAAKPLKYLSTENP